MEPDTIIDQPVPLLSGEFIDLQPISSSSDSGVTSPEKIADNSIPTGAPASEVVSSSLDTSTRKIKGTFNFEQMGAITIGQISISPTGIIGVDLSGNTTFSIDPNTGSATFRGTVAATNFIGGTISIGSNFSVDSSGNMIASNATINGNITGGTIAIGSGSTIFRVDSGGNHWIGGTTFNNAAWRVSSSGAMDAGVSSFMSGRLIIDNNNSISKTGGDLIISVSGGFVDFQTGVAVENGLSVLNGINTDYMIFSTHGNLTNDGALWLYNAGGSTRYWRSRAGGFNGQFNQSGF